MKTERVKYPRTFHLPYSPTLCEGDKRLETDSMFQNMEEVVCSIKMDGENTTVYPDGTLHARSVDGTSHPWQTWLKQFSSLWAKDIPEGYRVCGENLYARHSIPYTFPNPGYFFQVFSIWNGESCLSWEDTWIYADVLGVKTVPIFYIGKYDQNVILEEFEKWKKDHNRNLFGEEVEGFVVRNSKSFLLSDFQANIAKWVRPGHVQTDVHWTTSWIPNDVLHKEKWEEVDKKRFLLCN